MFDTPDEDSPDAGLEMLRLAQETSELCPPGVRVLWKEEKDLEGSPALSVVTKEGCFKITPEEGDTPQDLANVISIHFMDMKEAGAIERGSSLKTAVECLRSDLINLHKVVAALQEKVLELSESSSSKEQA